MHGSSALFKVRPPSYIHLVSFTDGWAHCSTTVLLHVLCIIVNTKCRGLSKARMTVACRINCIMHRVSNFVAGQRKLAGRSNRNWVFAKLKAVFMFCLGILHTKKDWQFTRGTATELLSISCLYSEVVCGLLLRQQQWEDQWACYSPSKLNFMLWLQLQCAVIGIYLYVQVLKLAMLLRYGSN